jgi:hypothetical protein
VEKLKGEYADTTVVQDTARQPSVAELEKATANLGRRITVRQDGKGDFTTIQAAIDTAQAGDLIEIQDNGIYNEPIVISAKKPGLVIRGARGRWPLLTSLGRNRDFEVFVRVEADAARIERMIVFHGTPRGGSLSFCLDLKKATRFRLRGVFLSVLSPGELINPADRETWAAERCIFAGGHNDNFNGGMVATDCLFLRNYLGFRWPHGEYTHCTILSDIVTEYVQFNFVDCILFDNSKINLENRFENCAFIKGKLPPKGIRCFFADPLFCDPANLDYRLRPGSPCIGKASDGGDIGVRWTPEMLEMIKVALELRRRGLIQF